jgi:hypothetical protein
MMAKRRTSPRTASEPLPAEDISRSIIFLRGQRVILDRELAAIYGVETRTFNQAVKRNTLRFPEDFMCQVTAEEVDSLRSMKKRNLTKLEMARRMRTSRVQLDRLLDPDNDSVTLATLCRAASVVGRALRLER